MSRRRLSGKLAVITGASAGVERAIAHAYAADGASVALRARTDEALEQAAAEVRAAGGESLVSPLAHARAGRGAS